MTGARAAVVAALGAGLLALTGLLASAGAASTGPATSQVAGEWLAVDFHVHTCFSHDAYCGPDDDNTDLSEAYTLSGDVNERFLEASLKGLDFLTITDHQDVRSQADPAFGSHGVIGVGGMENSLSGHAQMIGAHREFPQDGATAAAVNAMADQLRAEGGVFQINHPDDSLEPFTGCAPADLTNLHWRYGLDVVPDTVEVWNTNHALQPPLPSGNDNDGSERFWECFLNAGHRVAATGGSDSHWLSVAAVGGVGNPTTWVFASERSERGVLDALRQGRTSVSFLPPTYGGTPLLLDGDGDANGTFEAGIGDEVAAGSMMRVRSGPTATGFLRVRTNLGTLFENRTMVAGGALQFRLPAGVRWVRAVLVDAEPPAQLHPTCFSLALTSLCRSQLVVVGLTSPIYVRP